MAAAAPPAQTIYDAMVAIGIDDHVIWNGTTQAEGIAAEIFNDDFNTCMDLASTELDENLRMYSALTVANGQIRLRPHEKRGILAFIHGSRDKIKVDENPALEAFPVANVQLLIRRYKNHDNYVKKKDTMSDNVKPVRFTEKVNWDE